MAQTRPASANSSMTKTKSLRNEVPRSQSLKVIKKSRRSQKSYLTWPSSIKNLSRLWSCLCFSYLKTTLLRLTFSRTSSTNKTSSQRPSSKRLTSSKVKISSESCKRTASERKILNTKTSSSSCSWVQASLICSFWRVSARLWNRWLKTRSSWTRSEKTSWPRMKINQRGMNSK